MKFFKRKNLSDREFTKKIAESLLKKVKDLEIICIDELTIISRLYNS